MTNPAMILGIDLGSTTVKHVLLEADTGRVVDRSYRRHGSAVVPALLECLRHVRDDAGCPRVHVRMTGSGALGLSRRLGVPFVQEVVAAADCLRHLMPGIDAAVELGGEDAKILYLSESIELRMNEACAGGTGAFIDQAAALMRTDAKGLDELAAKAGKVHPIASRCGVFAKTDIVGLLNTGVDKAEIARSIFNAVAEQAVSGLSCGRPLKGRIAFLGGPLSFLPELRAAFRRRIGSEGVSYFDFPDSQYAVAMGAALDAMKTKGPGKTGRKSAGAKDGGGTPVRREAVLIDDLVAALESGATGSGRPSGLPPLFSDAREVEAFRRRHRRAAVRTRPVGEARGDLYLGVDLGSTTVKCVLTDAGGAVLHHGYAGNNGAPVPRLLEQVREVLSLVPDGAAIRSVCTTGYGASLARSVLDAGFEEVETLAHQRAARSFDPETSYVIDIGGQDMKCLRVDDGRIAGVTLNEACSSGCGAFLETFSAQLGLSIPDFVEAALTSEHPCDLGSRCTVFMTSKVRQAQREGAPTADIAAGLCISIVRNALHKVLKVKDPAELGTHVVVQGGTFLNDAVLRAFEMHTGLEVVRPDLAGLMGAYGAALLARDRTRSDTPLWDPAGVAFDIEKATKRVFRCGGCHNRCRLTQHSFPSGRRFVSGNRCDFALKNLKSAIKKEKGFIDWKLERLFGTAAPGAAADKDDDKSDGKAAVSAPAPVHRGEIGLPRVLNMYEHHPYWEALFSRLGIRTVLSPASNARMNLEGTETVPSQSLCLPAKLAHGHIVWLARKGVKRIWMPCIPKEEKLLSETDASYACPVVGGYPEALRLNVAECVEGAEVMTPFLRPDRPDSVVRALRDAFPEIPVSELRDAVAEGGRALARYRADIAREARRIWNSGDPVVVLAAHPYHLDAFVHHGIPNLIESMGWKVLTEDAVALISDAPARVDVVNQWAFHGRLYRAAEMAVKRPRTELVQLVSFGCGIDAITSEQVRRIMERAGHLYTMLKIDETDSLGAARIRIASLFAAMKDREASEAGSTNPASSGTAGSTPSPAHPVRSASRSRRRTIPIVKADARQDTHDANDVRDDEDDRDDHGDHGGLGGPGGSPSSNASGGSIPGLSGLSGLADLPGVSHLRNLFGNVSKANSPDCGGQGGAVAPSARRRPYFRDVPKHTTLYMPQMAPIHFPLVAEALRAGGYDVAFLPEVSDRALELGLRYVNNDTCYPAIVVIGQLLEAIERPGFDRGNAAFLLSQTCGPCRATNYPTLLKWALRDMGEGDIPVVTFAMREIEGGHRLKLSFKDLRRLVASMLLGDLLQRLTLHLRAHETNPGDTVAKLDAWTEKLRGMIRDGLPGCPEALMEEIVADFASIPRSRTVKPVVGIVGEILLKYHPKANLEMVERILAEDAEPRQGDLTNFILYCLEDYCWQARYFNDSKVTGLVSLALLTWIERRHRMMGRILERHGFPAVTPFKAMQEGIRGFVTEGQQAGEGWLLTAEMIEFLKSGVDNVLCLQPFACLPNHITGRGVMRAIRRTFENANVCGIDFEAGTAESNVANRVKLFLSQSLRKTTGGAVDD